MASAIYEWVPEMESQDRSWRFNGLVENENRLKPLCQEIEKHFQLPPLRLCRYFAAVEDPELRNIGKHYRGFHAPYPTDEHREPLPIHLYRCFFRPLAETAPEAVRAFDNLIYIRASTCAETIGFVTTYAHELQHFVQYGTLPRLHFVNDVLYHNLKTFEKKAITTDIPNGREANIISKRVAEVLCGSEEVHAFAENQIKVMEEAGEVDERARWIFFRDVSPLAEYDYLAHTLEVVEKYKTVLDFGIDVNQPEWWLGPLEA